MSALCKSELPESDRQPIPKPDLFADAMARFRAACPPRELSEFDRQAEAVLGSGKGDA